MEREEVEFKETLRLNLFTNKVAAGLAEKAAREIVAFMNTQGGKIIVGVADDGQLLGIDADIASFATATKPGTEDDFRLYIDHAVRDRLGMEYLGYVHVRFETLAT